MGGERGDVGEAGDAARGDDRKRHLPREFGGALGIDPDQRAIAGDVGVDDRGDPGVDETPPQRDRADPAGFGPALDRHMTLARIDADDDPVGVIAGGAAHQRGVAQCDRAKHDAVDPEIEPIVDRGAVADAAAELDPEIDRQADRPHRLAIHRPSGKSAVEIDDVEPVETNAGEVAGLRRRIVVEHGRARHLAAQQANAGAALQVDGRKEDHGCGPARRWSSRRL